MTTLILAALALVVGSIVVRGLSGHRLLVFAILSGVVLFALNGELLAGPVLSLGLIGLGFWLMLRRPFARRRD